MTNNAPVDRNSLSVAYEGSDIFASELFSGYLEVGFFLRRVVCFFQNFNTLVLLRNSPWFFCCRFQRFFDIIKFNS